MLTEASARTALGLADDVEITQTQSGERCTWQAGGDATRSVTLTQGERMAPASFFADHPKLTDVATSKQKDGGLHIAVEEVSSGVEITVLLSVRTLVLALPEKPANVPELISAMTGIGV